MTKWQLLVLDWSNCDRCELSQTRKKVVLAKGKFPCDILFVGEAPGESEDVVGVPFTGPAGRKLDEIIEQAIGPPGPDRPTLAFTNIISCIPRTNTARKTTKIDHEWVEACSPRLVSIVEMADPKLVVCVGKLSSENIGAESRGYKHRIRFHREIPTVDIVHPSAILRANYIYQTIMVQRAAVVLAEAVGELK